MKDPAKGGDQEQTLWRLDCPHSMANGRDGKWQHQMREGEQQERAMAMANGRCVSSRKNGRVRAHCGGKKVGMRRK